MTFNASVPADGDSPDTLPTQLQTNWGRIKTIINANHTFNNASASDDGYHKVVEFANQSNHPTNGNLVKAYTKTEYSALGRNLVLQTSADETHANFKTWLSRIGNESDLEIAEKPVDPSPGTSVEILDLSGFSNCILKCYAYGKNKTASPTISNQLFAESMLAYDSDANGFINQSATPFYVLGYTGDSLINTSSFTIVPNKLQFQTDGSTKLKLINRSSNVILVRWVVEIKRLG